MTQSVYRYGEISPVFTQQRTQIGTDVSITGGTLNVNQLVTAVDISTALVSSGENVIGDVLMPAMSAGNRLLVVWVAPGTVVRIAHGAPNILTHTGTDITIYDYGAVELVFIGSKWMQV